jgi:hypothetical protein
MFVKLVVFITKPISVAIESSQLIQPVVELVQMENPQFSRFQHVQVPGHSTETLRQISMFLEQIVLNATT